MRPVRLSRFTTSMRRAAFVSLALVAGCLPLKCGRARVTGEYGPYPERPGYLIAADGARLPVYRLKVWSFANGQPPAIQLEYESPSSVTDTAAVRRSAHAVWPALLPYLEQSGVHHALITATNLQRENARGSRIAKLKSHAIVARRDTSGTWYFDGDPAPLVAAGKPSSILRPDGSPLPVPAIPGSPAK